MKKAVMITGYLAAVTMFVIGLLFALNYGELKIISDNYTLNYGIGTNLYPKASGYVVMGMACLCAGVTMYYSHEVKE